MQNKEWELNLASLSHVYLGIYEALLLFYSFEDGL